MKKIFAVLLVILILTGVLAGCCKASELNESTDRISIVTTIFPEYDWVREIIGNTENVNLIMLLDTGVDLHSYQPTADDIITISTCDMFIYVGGESDEWVEEVLREAANKDMTVIKLLDVLGDTVNEEEIVEGMEGDDEGEEAEEEEGPEFDEHIWLSLKNAKTLCAYIAGELGTLDGENAAAYKANAEKYISKLDALDMQYQAAVSSAAKDTILFGDRFPFRYLVDDYGLSYYAAFVGCSAETEASFETITFLANKLDELGLSAVLTIESSDGKIAQTIISNTSEKSQKLLVMDSLQAVTSKDVKNGTTYLSVMEENLEVLKEALN